MNRMRSIYGFSVITDVTCNLLVTLIGVDTLLVHSKGKHPEGQQSVIRCDYARNSHLSNLSGIIWLF